MIRIARKSVSLFFDCTDESEDNCRELGIIASEVEIIANELGMIIPGELWTLTHK